MNWKTTALGEFAESVDYGVTASASDEPIGPKFLRITDIQAGEVNWANVPWCRCDNRSASEARLKPGDLVFARTGATTGKSFLIRECPIDSVFASYLIRVRVGHSADPRYVSQFFQTPDYWSQITKSARGVAQPGINATTLKALQIPLPPMEEQRRIADVLDRAETLRAKRRAALGHLNSLIRSIFLDLFGNPVTNLMEWTACAVSEVTDCVVPGRDKPKSFTGSIPWITTDDLFHLERTFDSSKGLGLSYDEIREVRAKVIPIGSVIISCVGDLGLVSTAGRDLVINQQLHSFQCHTNLNNVFLMHCLAFQRPFMYAKASSTTLPYMNKSVCNSIPVVVPPIALQGEFARRVDAIDNLKISHRRSLEDMNALFNSLQHRAFRGEL